MRDNWDPTFQEKSFKKRALCFKFEPAEWPSVRELTKYINTYGFTGVTNIVNTPAVLGHRK